MRHPTDLLNGRRAETAPRRPLVASLVAGAALLTVLASCGGDPESSSFDAEAPTLGPVDTLVTPAPPGSNTPHLALDTAGRVLLSWTQRAADSTVSVRFAAWDGTSWDSTRTIAAGRPFFVNWADFPAITTLGNGDLAAHWLEREGTGKYAYGVRVVRSSDGGRTWSAPVTPHTDGLEAEHGFVSLWAEGADRLGLVWLDGRKSAMADSAREMTIRTAHVAPSGALEEEALVDARTCDCCQTGTTGTRGGRVIVYRDRNPEEIRDIAVVRRTANGWTAPATVHEDRWHYPGCPVNGPQAASSGDTVVVAWFTGAADTARVLMARSTDGGATFSAPVRVDDGDPIGRVDVVLDARGDAIVVWLEQRSPELAEVLVRRVTGNAPGPIRVLSRTSGARQSGFPRLVRRGDALIAAWTHVEPQQKSMQVRLATLSLSPTR